MRRATVGVSAYAEQARWGGVWDLPAVLLPQPYVDSVAASGAAPVLLPPVQGAVAAVPRLDALVLAGGADIDPGRYGSPTGPRTTGVQPARDTAEIDLLTTALDLGIPVLGICRGMQLLNIARGGTLLQHLPDVVGSSTHCRRTGVFDNHTVTVARHTRTAEILGRTELTVPTHHHQGLADLGTGVVATAWADDGVVEAIEYADTPNVVGVQWNPEMSGDLSLFAWLTDHVPGTDAARA